MTITQGTGDTRHGHKVYPLLTDGRTDWNSTNAHIGTCGVCGFGISRQSLNDGFVASLETGYVHVGCMRERLPI